MILFFHNYYKRLKYSLSLNWRSETFEIELFIINTINYHLLYHRALDMLYNLFALVISPLKHFLLYLISFRKLNSIVLSTSGILIKLQI